MLCLYIYIFICICIITNKTLLSFYKHDKSFRFAVELLFLLLSCVFLWLCFHRTSFFFWRATFLLFQLLEFVGRIFSQVGFDGFSLFHPHLEIFIWYRIRGCWLISFIYLKTSFSCVLVCTAVIENFSVSLSNAPLQ